MTPQPPLPTKIRVAINAACEFFSITEEEFFSSGRSKDAVLARDAVAWSCKMHLSDISVARLGVYVRRHHTSILASHRRTAMRIARCGSDDLFVQAIVYVETAILAGRIFDQPNTLSIH
jgi:chromosomal replication initiation ATPase DnaA